MSTTTIELRLEGGGATPAPPVGTALGSKGVSTRDFCMQFNAATQHQKGKLLRVSVVVRPDKKFHMIIKGTPTAALIKEEAKIAKGSGEPNRNKVGKIDRLSVERIIEKMGKDLRGHSQEAKCNTIMGIARSMGVEITE